MKQLKILYTIYNQQGNPLHSATFETTYYDELPASILKSALSLISHASGNGWYAITDISTISLAADL